jgi:hypothetical protein
VGVSVWTTSPPPQKRKLPTHTQAPFAPARTKDVPRSRASRVSDARLDRGSMVMEDVLLSAVGAGAVVGGAGAGCTDADVGRLDKGLARLGARAGAGPGVEAGATDPGAGPGPAPTTLLAWGLYVGDAAPLGLDRGEEPLLPPPTAPPPPPPLLPSTPGSPGCPGLPTGSPGGARGDRARLGDTITTPSPIGEPSPRTRASTSARQSSSSVFSIRAGDTTTSREGSFSLPPPPNPTRRPVPELGPPASASPGEGEPRAALPTP